MRLLDNVYCKPIALERNLIQFQFEHEKMHLDERENEPPIGNPLSNEGDPLFLRDSNSNKLIDFFSSYLNLYLYLTMSRFSAPLWFMQCDPRKGLRAILTSKVVCLLLVEFCLERTFGFDF